MKQIKEKNIKYTGKLSAVGDEREVEQYISELLEIVNNYCEKNQQTMNKARYTNSEGI